MMKALGITRRVDSLGRIVLPKETRRIYGMNDGDYIETFADAQGIYVRKYVKGDKMAGIVRSIDPLGRISVPKESRDRLGIKLNDAVEFFVDGEGLYLAKYNPGCVFCGGMDGVFEFEGYTVCRKCAAKIVNKLAAK